MIPTFSVFLHMEVIPRLQAFFYCPSPYLVLVFLPRAGGQVVSMPFQAAGGAPFVLCHSWIQWPQTVHSLLHLSLCFVQPAQCV